MCYVNELWPDASHNRRMIRLAKKVFVKGIFYETEKYFAKGTGKAAPVQPLRRVEVQFHSVLNSALDARGVISTN